MAKLDYNDYFSTNGTMISIMSNPLSSSEDQINNRTDHISYMFCRTIEDGGDIDNLDELKIILNEHKYQAHSIADSILASKNLKIYLNDEQIDIIRKAIRSYAKVSDDPIFQEVLNKYHWNK